MGMIAIERVNEAVALLAPGVSLERTRNGIFVNWRVSGRSFRKRWMCRGQSFYPVWSRSFGFGGTTTTALSQLIRFSAGRPVLPMSTWRYWTGETVALARERGPALLSKLKELGYPDRAECVLCRKPISGPLDWWSLDGVSGPCCGYATGCRQKGT